MRVIARTGIISMRDIEIKASIVLYTLKYFLDRSSVSNFSSTLLSDIFLALSVLFLMLFLMRNMLNRVANINKFPVIKTISLVVLVAIAVLIFRVIPYVIYIYTILLIVSARYVDGKVILQTIKKSMIIMLLILICSSLVGVIPNISTVTGRYNLGLECRSVGWDVLNYSAIVLYYRKKKEKNIYLWLITINSVVFFFTKTRLSFILFFIMIIFSALEDYDIKLGRMIQKVLSYSFLALFFVMLLLTTNYTRFPVIDNLFSGRLRFGMRVINAYGIGLWPRLIEYFTQKFETGSFTMYVDSGYIDLLVRFGIVLTGVVLIGYTILAQQAVKNKNYRLFIWLLTIALFNMVNNSFFNVFYDSSVILFWTNNFYYNVKDNKIDCWAND